MDEVLQCTEGEYCSNGWAVSKVLLQDGKECPVAVAGGIAGEMVRVSELRKERIDHTRRSAQVSCVVSPSCYRVEPCCPHFLTCGGCAFQHIAYSEQLRIKQTRIEGLYAPLVTSSTRFDPIIGSDKVYGYRNKMEFTFSQDKRGNHFLGLYSCLPSSRVEDLSCCPLTPEWMSKVVHAVRSYWAKTNLLAYNTYKNIGSLISLTLREGQTSQDRMVILTVSANPAYALRKGHLRDFVDAVQTVFSDFEGIVSVVLRLKQMAKGRSTQYYEMILHGPDYIREFLNVEVIQGRNCSLEFQISPHSFFQPNTQQAQKIYSAALQMAKLGSEDTVFDLYCGIGIFGMFAAQIAKMSYGVELSADSAYDAKTNSERLKIGNFVIKTGDVASSLTSFERKEIARSTIIVDPPRAGLLRASVEEITKLSPNRIVYVSCNPATQVGDVARFLESGWQIERILPVDQFPQTPHVENIVSLCRV